MSAGALRGGAFGALALFVALAPASRQVFGGEGRLLRAWHMFSTPGIGLVDARFRLRTEAGEIPLDRYETLGIALARGAPSRIRRPRGPGEFWTLVRDLCERLGAGADLRADVRIAVRAGWHTVALPAGSLCEAPAPPEGGV